MLLNIGSQRVQKENEGEREREKKKLFWKNYDIYCDFQDKHFSPKRKFIDIWNIARFIYIFFLLFQSLRPFYGKYHCGHVASVLSTIHSKAIVLWLRNDFHWKFFFCSISLRFEMRPQFFAIQFHYLRFVLCQRWLSHSRYMPDVLHFNYFEKSQSMCSMAMTMTLFDVFKVRFIFINFFFFIHWLIEYYGINCDRKCVSVSALMLWHFKSIEAVVRTPSLLCLVFDNKKKYCRLN